jgi:hypothetical protein
MSTTEIPEDKPSGSLLGLGLSEWLGVMRAAITAAKAARVAAADKAERHAVAKAFNDRYCYRVLYDAKAERLTGTAMYGMLPRGGNRWMCPDCNRIHAPTECSVFSGLQYPACCTAGRGHRLDQGVRVS